MSIIEQISENPGCEVDYKKNNKWHTLKDVKIISENVITGWARGNGGIERLVKIDITKYEIEVIA